MQQEAQILPRFETPSPGRAGVISWVRYQGGSKLQVGFCQLEAGQLLWSSHKLTLLRQLRLSQLGMWSHWHSLQKQFKGKCPSVTPGAVAATLALANQRRWNSTLDYAYFFFCISHVNDNPSHLLLSSQAFSMANSLSKEAREMLHYLNTSLPSLKYPYVPK